MSTGNLPFVPEPDEQLTVSTARCKRPRSYTGIDGINQQDRALQESMGPIVDRSREHLGRPTGDHPGSQAIARSGEGRRSR